VRTYVRVADRPGVYFFSLDAGSTVAVRAARTLLNLPYYSATMTVAPRERGVAYYTQRDDTSMAAFTATYEPDGGPPFLARKGGLEPWRLEPARAQFLRNTMAEVNGIALPSREPLLHFVKRQDMVAWAPAPLR